MMGVILSACCLFKPGSTNGSSTTISDTTIVIGTARDSTIYSYRPVIEYKDTTIIQTRPFVAYHDTVVNVTRNGRVIRDTIRSWYSFPDNNAYFERRSSEDTITQRVRTVTNTITVPLSRPWWELPIVIAISALIGAVLIFVGKLFK
jgi:hypothetical protein